MLKKISLFIAVVVLVVALARFCHKQTAGFAVTKITSNFSLDAELSGEEPLVPTEEIRQILNQKFTYLGRGLQSFAFVSEDGQYVIKLLSNRLQRRLKLFDLFTLPAPWNKWREQKVKKCQEKLEKTFTSYKIAFAQLKEETGLIYMHLQPTNHYHKKLIIADKLGIFHPIDLDKTAFIVQKKATLFYPTLLELRQKGDLNQAKILVSRLLAFLLARCQKGIADSDPLIRTNFGFVEDKVIEIDVGPFSKDEKMKESGIFIPEIGRITASLKDWAHKNYPELSEYIENEVERVE